MTKKLIVYWIKDHKTELITAGILITGIIAAILITKDYDKIAELFEPLKKAIEPVGQSEQHVIDHINSCENNYSTGRAPHIVNEHIRNLPEGWSASDLKLNTATSHGFVLEKGQTWVGKYFTGRISA